MRHTRNAGQASTDYVAVLLVVGVLLTAAGAAAAAVPGVGDRIAHAVRTGICIVGGDVCRSADAAAAGLDPCVTRARHDGTSTTLDVAVLRVGERGEWQIALRSDGSALVTRLEGSEIGGSLGVGVTFSPAGIDASARATVTAGYRGGRAWHFDDAAAAAAFLERARGGGGPDRAPDVRWDGLGGNGTADVSLAIGELASAGIETAVDGALGLRRQGSRRTLSLDLGAEAPHLVADVPGLSLPPGKRTAIVVDVTWETGTARELALRTATASGDRMEELTARLDLTDPESRAVAERALRPGGDQRADLRALAVRIAGHGVVERAGYVTTEDRRGISVAGRLGVALGLSHERVTGERRLVDAIAWVRGGPPQRRFDCLGV